MFIPSSQKKKFLPTDFVTLPDPVLQEEKRHLLALSSAYGQMQILVHAESRVDVEFEESLFFS